MQFVPIPRQALDVLEPELWGAAVDLYQRADRLRWKSFEVTERSLASRWGLGSTRVRRVLAELEAAGLLTVMPGPTARSPRRLLLVKPTQSVTQSVTHGKQHEQGQSEQVQRSHQRSERRTSTQTSDSTSDSDSLSPYEQDLLISLVGKVLEQVEDEHISAGREFGLTDNMVTNRFVADFTRLLQAECVMSSGHYPSSWEGRGPPYPDVAKELRRRCR